MTLANGYETKTTFIQDFRIAEVFGISAIKDTFKRAFREWKSNIEYLTELAIAVNMLCWYHYNNGNSKLSELYEEYFYKVRDYVYEKDRFTKAEQEYYFNITD